MTTATPQRLAEIGSAVTLFSQANRAGSSSLTEPLAGALAAEQFLQAITDGEAEPDDAWTLLCQHLHRWSPHADPRLQGFVTALAKAAAAVPTINFVREA